MDVDLNGRVANTKLPASHCLLPLFEAVANSIQPIQDARPTKGHIDIRVERDFSQGVLRPEHKPGLAVDSFTVVDNGVGFTTEQFKSFLTSDSRHKAARGGKGVGRFLWLKAFRHAEIDSTYAEDGKTWHRRFTFVLTSAGVEGASLEPADAATQRTSVRLVGLQGKYREACPRSAEAIARKVVEHCLEYFIHGTAPKVVLTDNTDGTEYVLNDIFQDEMKGHQKTATFELNGKKFRVTHMLVPPAAADNGHKLHFCAHQRAVKTESVGDRMPELRSGTSPIRDPETTKQLFYAGFVSGELLDDTVASDRTGFNLEDEVDVFEQVPWGQLVDKSLAQAGSYLAPHLEPIRKRRDDQIQDFVQTAAPEYRPLIKHRKELLADIPPNLPPDKLELELHKADQKYGVELRERYQELLATGDGAAVDFEEHKRQVEQFLQEWNEAGMAKLARHVAHRKATLAFLGEQLKLDGDGKYRLEDAIHKIIFPLKKTSDDVPPDQQNLWIIDEKLAYHHYLASDTAIKKLKPMSVDSKDRPDIIVFNRPIAVVDSEAPFGSVVIVEFKRPMRDDYAPAEKPIDQVYDYVRQLRGGKAVDRDGRPINLRPDTPFYAYVVCDVTPTLREMAENRSLRATPDNEGFFGYQEKLGVYVEVISFPKLLSDAQRRNKVLFDFLGLGLVKSVAD